MTTTRDADGDVQTAVIEELKFAPDIDSTHISVAVHQGAITLSGEVDSYPEKVHAERAALRVRGVRSVDERIGVRSLWGVGLDAILVRTASEALERAVDVPPGCVTATSHHRVLTLSGSTPWQYQRTAAMRAVTSLKGVCGVLNEIVVRPQLTPEGVEEAIKNALMRNGELEGEHVTVTAVGGDVTLTGTVGSWAEHRAADRAAWSAPGIANVHNQLTVRPGSATGD